MVSADPLSGVQWLIGDADSILKGKIPAALPPFFDGILDFLDAVSKELMALREAKPYPDVVTFAFWIRRAQTVKLKERFYKKEDGNVHLGRGLAFHIAPSNVPVNFAYSLAAGLLTGNANVVRVPTKEFPQVAIICGAIEKVVNQSVYRALKPYINLVRYDREKAVNDIFSSLADTRIIWGGDNTVAEIRRSPLPPRASEIPFADRYSIAVIDSDAYLAAPDPSRVARDFYNDTFLSDQNACTSPRLIAWLGNRREEAKEKFWANLYAIVKKEYHFQPIMGVNKLTSGCLAAVTYAREAPERRGVVLQRVLDNRIVRVQIPKIIDALPDLKENSGYFFEYDCDDILELKGICDDNRCQTLAYLGDKEQLLKLLKSGIRGIDRVVPIGKSMDFDLIWDGFNLYERLTRVISIS